MKLKQVFLGCVRVFFIFLLVALVVVVVHWLVGINDPTHQEASAVVHRYYCEPWSIYCSESSGCEAPVENAKWVVELETATHGVQKLEVSCSKFNTVKVGDRAIFIYRDSRTIGIKDRGFSPAPPLQ